VRSAVGVVASAVVITLYPPTSVTAVYVPAGTKVTVAWVPPDLTGADTWVVRRFDGTVVATVPVGTLTVDDGSPVPGTGTYSVEGVQGAYTGSKAFSASMTISLQPATATATVSGETIIVNWTAGPQGDPDAWYIYNATEGGWLATGLAGSARTFTTPAMTPGRVFTIGVWPYLSGAQATGRNTNTAGIPPRVTRPQTWGPVGLNTLQYTFWGPAAGLADNYDIDYYISSWVPWIYGTTSGGPHNLGTGSPAYVRSRTNSQGMSSGWTQSGPATPTTDVTGPPSTAITIGAWDVNQAAYNVSWPAHYDSSGNGVTRFQYNINSGGWQESGVAYPAGPAYSGLVGGFGRGVTVSFRLRMTDALGNTTYGPATGTVWTRPLGGFIAYANNSYTWGNVSGFGWMGNDRCVGGSYGGNENYGFWWYGANITNICKTFTPDRMFFWSQKVSGLSSAGTAYLAVHNQANYDGTVPGVGGIFHAPSLAVVADNTQFGAGWYPGFANGQNAGACVVGNGQPFKALYGKNEASDSGAITIYFDA